MKEEDDEVSVLLEYDECAICYENIYNSEDILEPCRHLIHKTCFLKTKSNLCPICRQNVVKPVPNITFSEQFRRMRDEEPITINEVAGITFCICIFYTLLVIIGKV